MKIPGYHYVDRKLDVTSHNKDYTSVEQCEISIARKPVVAWLFQSQIKAEIRSGVIRFNFQLNSILFTLL